MKNKSTIFLFVCSTLLALGSIDVQASCGQGSLLAITTLPTLGGSFIEADALNAASQITGFSYASGDSEAHIFLFSSNVISDLGTLGGTFGQGFTLNNLGDVAGYANIAGDLETHAFLFTSNHMFDLGTLGGNFSIANSVNNAGWVVGNSVKADFTTVAFLYSNGSMNSLGTLGGDWSSAWAINQAGIIIGDSYTANDFEYHSFIYSNSTMIDLGTLGGAYSSSVALNDAGAVIGESSLTNGNIHGFLYSNGIMTDIGTLGGTFSSANAVNNSNQAVGVATTVNDSETHGFIYSGTMTDLGTLGGTYSEADAINNNGQVVGYATTSDGNPRAFLWQNGTMTDLNSLLPTNSGWELQIATFINNSGRIVGQGIFNGTFQWYVLDLSSADNPPIAVAGPDQTADCHTPVTLDGSQSSDPDGGALTFAWSESGVVLGTNSTLIASFDIGTHVITLTVSDSCGSTAATNVTVVVSDMLAPVITSAPAPITSPADANCQAQVPNVLSSIVATDNCTPANQLIVAQNPAAGTLLGDGSYLIAVTVKDASGNITATNITLNVVDQTAPIILSAPASLTASSDTNCQAAVPNIVSSISVTDNCTPANQLTIVQSPAAGTLLGHGQYNIAVTIKDASGNTTSLNIPFSVVDTTAPVIQSVMANPNVLSSPNHQMVPITVSVIATDNCDAAPLNRIISITANEPIAAGDIQITGNLSATLAASRNPSGTGRIYTITVQCTDASGNSSTATTTVTVPQGNGNGNTKKAMIPSARPLKF